MDVAPNRKASPISQAVLRWGPASLYSRAVGAAARMPLPVAMRGAAVRAFARAVGADLGEADRPSDDYPTLGAFFARELRQGARPVAADAQIVAPSDGIVSAVGRCDDGELVQAKGQHFALADLLGDAALADELRGGSYATIYLSPRDYHRVHTPVAGTIEHYDYIPGARWPVSLPFVARVPGLYARNERAVACVRLASGQRAAVVLVAAIGVGNLYLTHWRNGGETRDTRQLGQAGVATRLPAGAALAAGAEIGAFMLGSTVVTVLPPGAGAFDLVVGEAVQCGQPVAAKSAGEGGPA